MTNLEHLTYNLQFAQLHIQRLAAAFDIVMFELERLTTSIRACKSSADEIEQESTTNGKEK